MVGIVRDSMGLYGIVMGWLGWWDGLDSIRMAYGESPPKLLSGASKKLDFPDRGKPEEG